MTSFAVVVSMIFEKTHGSKDMLETLDFGGNWLSKHTIPKVPVLTHKLTSGGSNILPHLIDYHIRGVAPPSDYHIRGVAPYISLL